ncbi:uncharacterized protein LOC127838953 [Dreissena polymorpha]|uniref:Uncharacterized protein n=1 Tax=Dreissena polymorpha TaxID=45954 RepID=A0A9D4FK21_DREPO|nr:uncharacterized protein LOC127838953 [Dreissena polymorpha]KAH3797895.1 hypothetical protein DPMN_151485 [Dreissena polymorpha]
MNGILVLAVLSLLADFTDAQITAWDITDLTISGTNGATAVFTKTVAVTETSTAGAAIVTLTATGTGGSPVINYAFTGTGNPGSVGNIASVTSGAITLATGKSLDYESGTSVVFVVTATEQSVASGNVIGTATVTVNIKNKLEYGQDQYGVCVPDGSAAGTVVGTYKASDFTSPETVTLSSDLTPGTSDLTYDTTTGILSVSTGKTLSQNTIGGYKVTLFATAGGIIVSDLGQSIVWVAVATCSGAIQATAVFAVLAMSFTTAMLF